VLYVDLEKKGKHCLISELHRRQVPCVYTGVLVSSRCILFDGENIPFDDSLVIYSINIPPIMIINRIYEHQNLLSL
jgi:hypothetical protein